MLRMGKRLGGILWAVTVFGDGFIINTGNSMKKFLIVPIFLALMGLSSSVYAKFYFGDMDSIHFLAKVNIPEQGGQGFFLGQRVTMSAFLMPYSVKDNGYVLGISGNGDKYIPLPEGVELEALQAQGYLPKPLPPIGLGWFDYLLGYSLWWALLFLFGVPYLKSKLFGR